MDALPLPQEGVLSFGHLGDQASQRRASDTNTVYHLGCTIWRQEIDLRLAVPGDVDVRRFVVERLDDEPEAICAMNHNHNGG
jgi:hypothetical protein